MYMDILCTKQSQKSTPGTVALPRSKKRARAHDDVVILKGKRLRKGPGYYTHLADSAPLPVEQEMAGGCSARFGNSSASSSLDLSCGLLCQMQAHLVLLKDTRHGSAGVALPAASGLQAASSRCMSDFP